MSRLVALAVLLPTVAWADDHRGWLTGAGLALSGGGLVAVSLGAYHSAQGEASRRGLAAYYANGAAPTAAEAPAVRWLQERSDAMGTTGLGLLISGGVAVLLGLGLVVFDGWVSVSVSPANASVLVSGTF